MIMEMSSSALPMMLLLMLLASIDGGNGVSAAFNSIDYARPITPFHGQNQNQRQQPQQRHQSCDTILSMSSNASPSQQQSSQQLQQQSPQNKSSQQSSQPQPQPQPQAPQYQSPISPEIISQATSTLQHYDKLQQTYMGLNPVGLGGGTAALQFTRTVLTPSDLETIRGSLLALTAAAHHQRATSPPNGRILLGFCAENVPEAMLGLRTWIPALDLPRGLLHGLDVDGVPMERPEELGCVYVKYNSGGSMTFAEMRETGLGFDALWKPGDAVLQTYDGDFRGVYYSVQLEDAEFRQFGVLPTDLFVEEEEW